MTYLEGKIINKVYHLADLHIRNLKRHKEYKKVFSTFLNQVKKDDFDDAIIYIGGDIAHAKTELSPELVDMISWFMNQCALLLPTFVITGNHDCNQNNPHRLDALTPIFDNLNNDNLHYLRDTGVYQIGNLTAGVFSILDHKDNWPKGTDIDGDNKLCFFHGPIYQSTTDVGYEISSSKFTTDIFDGYHIAMLGDIHKRQTVQLIDEANDKPFIQYAGSMIQQNHGETLEKHGYLLWDIPSRTFKEFDIKNEWGYVTIDIEDNVIPQWVYDEIENKKLPKHPKLRVRFTGTDASDMKYRLTELQNLFKVSEISFSRMDTMSQLKLGRNLSDTIGSNLKDVSVQNNLISEYLERNFLLDDDVIQNVLNINQEINNELAQSNELVGNNIIWTPNEFEFSNMFSYGENNLIRFNSLQGLVGLFAANASGKSSIFDAISFCMFDKCSRAFKAEHIMNTKKDTFKCKFEITIDGEQYFIERRAKRYRKGQKVKVNVDFWKTNSVGEEESLNGEQRRDTNKIIEQYLGTYDDFVLTALSLQGNNALFIDKSQSERKDILSQFMGADICDRLYTIASEKNKESLTLIKKFKNDDFSNQLSSLINEIRSKKNEYREIETQLKRLKEEEETLQDTVEELNEKLISLDVNITDVDQLKSKLMELKDEISGHENSLESIQLNIDKITKQIDTHKDVISKHKSNNISDKIADLNSLKSKLTSLNNDNEKIELQIQSQQDRIHTHVDYEYDDDCEYCVKNAEQIISIRDDANKNLIDLNLKLSAKTEEIDDVESAIADLQDVESSWTDYETHNNRLNKLETSLFQSKEKKLYSESKLLNLKDQHKTVNKSIDDYYKHEKDFKYNVSIKEEISEYKHELIALREEISEANEELLEVNGTLSTVQNKKETLVERINEVRELEEYHKLLEYYLDTVKRNGIPYELISKAIPALEGEINNILSQTVDFVIQLEVDGKNINANIIYDDDARPLEMGSGMERFISGLAIRVALINVCNLPRPNFLVIDEGLGTLDSENLQSVFLLFNYLKSQFDFVILISHLDTSRDFVDSLIEIRNDPEGFSNIRI